MKITKCINCQHSFDAPATATIHTAIIALEEEGTLRAGSFEQIFERTCHIAGCEMPAD